tara:strand:- start:7270 stop:7710 length:441 start_codon:yes stop_codon:yes gene_type:complete
MEQKTFAERIAEALSNTETLPALENLREKSDEESVLGTVSPAVQAVCVLHNNLCEEAQETHDRDHEELGVCTRSMLRRQIDIVNGLFWTLIRDEFKSEKITHDPTRALGMRANWEIVIFKDEEPKGLFGSMEVVVMTSRASAPEDT